ncbi:MAG TPA: hypothetical protein ENJ82_18310 [Bacteroidetes bacterium]|nr:hypothetical protein [Bacteroidota bacterium]
MKKFITALLLLLCLTPVVMAQDEAENSEPITVPELFYGTRTINFQTVRQIGKKVLAYRISHRFGSFTDDALYNWVGLDGPASISFMFDYGITDKLMIGLARDQFQKTYNGFVKYNLMDQQSGGGSPVSVSLYGKANIISLRPPVGGFNRYESFSNRMAYTAQILVARRFGDRFALQVAPTFIHLNLVDLAGDKNDILAITASAQVMLTKRLGISGEFSYTLNEYSPVPERFFPSAGVGLDIVTGGHVFQITFTNSRIINETFLIPYSRADWFKGDFRIGFNISRNFWL